MKRFNLGFGGFGPKEYCDTGKFLSWEDHQNHTAELEQKFNKKLEDVHITADFRQSSYDLVVLDNQELKRRIQDARSDYDYYVNENREIWAVRRDLDRRLCEMTRSRNRWRNCAVVCFGLVIFWCAVAIRVEYFL